MRMGRLWKRSVNDLYWGDVEHFGPTVKGNDLEAVTVKD